jgi:hypothetical protein
VLANVSSATLTVSWDDLPPGTAERDELLALCPLDRREDGLVVEPYAVFWFSLRQDPP